MRTEKAPVLLLVHGAERRHVEVTHTPFTIGRRADRDLVIPDPRVSREHASVIEEDGKYFIVDDGGSGGVWVNRLPRERQELKPNDRCYLGVDDVYFVFNPTVPITEPSPPPSA